MPIDPYGLCPCGSGKKTKWCCSKILSEVEKILDLIESNQADNAIRALDRLSGDPTNPRYVRALRAQALASFGRFEEAVTQIEQTIEAFPDYGLAHEVMADLLMSQSQLAPALSVYHEALVAYPPEADRFQARVLTKMGQCHHYQGKPLAAWAAFQGALKCAPDFQPAQEMLDELIKKNTHLPNAVRHGLKLKPPDELAVFNETRQEKWNAAIGEGMNPSLDDLIAAFEYLANDDTYDLAAWYNLALAHAWDGDNVMALEALEHYVKQETDFEAAADAWDLGEVLRLGQGTEALSDNLVYASIYQPTDPSEFLARIKSVREIAVTRTENEGILLHWLDKPLEQDSGPTPILGGLPRRLAQIQLMPRLVQLEAYTAEHRTTVKNKLEQAAGDTIVFVQDLDAIAPVEMLDSEPLFTAHLALRSSKDPNKAAQDSFGRYYEEDWIRRPLRSLGGLAPIDASQSEAFKKKLEGVIRFRERNVAGLGIPYDFDRLRRKLGLPVTASPEKLESDKADLSLYSAAQLAALTPADLSDDDLLVAYRTATSLDASRTAIEFAVEVLNRDAMASKIDVMPLIRRMVVDRLETGLADKAETLLGSGRTYLERNGKGTDHPELDALAARIQLARGNIEQAGELYRTLFGKHPENLDLVARAAENLLSKGAFGLAREFAQSGLQQAERLRSRQHQEQFREYLDAAGSRT